MNETQKRSRPSGEHLDYLMLEFRKNPNPLLDIRREIADRTGLPEKLVRIWFQNRRAKTRKKEKEVAQAPVPAPVNINEHYCYIACKLLLVGDWQRVCTGHVVPGALAALVNLLPNAVAALLETCDLLVVLLLKNHELNYFFRSVFDGKTILFRIFYPVSGIMSSLVVELDELDDHATELRVHLVQPPKFCVHFLLHTQNKWGICEDFSENQQVGHAYHGGNGTGDPHVIIGDSTALHFLNNYIVEKNLLVRSSYNYVNPPEIPGNAYADDSLGVYPPGDDVFFESPGYMPELSGETQAPYLPNEPMVAAIDPLVDMKMEFGADWSGWVGESQSPPE